VADSTERLPVGMHPTSLTFRPEGGLGDEHGWRP
jgi:hypothetical protein